MNCPTCGRTNPDDSRFCRGCGRPLGSDVICPACGASNPPDSSFCNKCGQPLASAAVTVPPQPTAPVPAAAPIRVLSSLLEAATLLGDREAAARLAPPLAGVIAYIDPMKSVALLVGQAEALLGDRTAARAHYERSLKWAAKIRFRPEVTPHPPGHGGAAAGTLPQRAHRGTGAPRLRHQGIRSDEDGACLGAGASAQGLGPNMTQFGGGRPSPSCYGQKPQPQWPVRPRPSEDDAYEPSGELPSRH